jgi:hypothetical protein
MHLPEIVCRDAESTAVDALGDYSGADQHLTTAGQHGNSGLGSRHDQLVLVAAAGPRSQLGWPRADRISQQAADVR